MKRKINNIIIITILLLFLLLPSCKTAKLVQVNKNNIFECKKLYQEYLFEIKDYKLFEIKDYILILQNRNDNLKEVIECQEKQIHIFTNDRK